MSDVGVVDAVGDCEPNWRLTANCLGLPWRTFFPQRGESTKPAKIVCAECSVKAECLEDAIYRREPAGVRGGLSTRDRRLIIREMNAQEKREKADI